MHSMKLEFIELINLDRTEYKSIVSIIVKLECIYTRMFPVFSITEFIMEFRQQNTVAKRIQTLESPEPDLNFVLNIYNFDFNMFLCWNPNNTSFLIVLLGKSTKTYQVTIFHPYNFSNIPVFPIQYLISVILPFKLFFINCTLQQHRTKILTIKGSNLVWRKYPYP